MKTRKQILEALEVIEVIMETERANGPVVDFNLLTLRNMLKWVLGEIPEDNEFDKSLDTARSDYIKRGLIVHTASE